MNCPHCQRPILDLIAATCPNCRKPLSAAPFGTAPAPGVTQAMPAQPQKTTRMSLTGELIEEEVRPDPAPTRAFIARDETPLLSEEDDPAARESERKLLMFLKVAGGTVGVLLLFGATRLVLGYSAQQQRFERSVKVNLSSPEVVTQEVFTSFQDGSAVRLYKVMQFQGDSHLLAEAAVEFNKGYFEPEGEYDSYRKLAQGMTDLKVGTARKQGQMAEVPLSATVQMDGKSRQIHGVAHLIQGPDDRKWRLNANGARIANPGNEEHQAVRALFDDLFGIRKKE